VETTHNPAATFMTAIARAMNGAAINLHQVIMGNEERDPELQPQNLLANKVLPQNKSTIVVDKKIETDNRMPKNATEEDVETVRYKSKIDNNIIQNKRSKISNNNHGEKLISVKNDKSIENIKDIQKINNLTRERKIKKQIIIIPLKSKNKNIRKLK